MSQMAVHHLESELLDEFESAPRGVAGASHVAFPKRPAAVNTIAHSLTGHEMILSADELPRYAQMGLDFMRELQPVGVLEVSCAQLIFESRWRVCRIVSIENHLFCLRPPASSEDGIALSDQARVRRPGLAQQVDAFSDGVGQIDAIARYETHLTLNSERLFKELDYLQEQRAHRAPHRVFDEASSPAVTWYRKVLTRCEELAKAMQNYDDYLHAADINVKAKPKTRKSGA
jgi:hypothetical protein